MGATFHDRPPSFQLALELAAQILSKSTELIERGTVEREAELIVAGAFQNVTGKPLSRSDLYFRLRDAFPDAAGDEVIRMATARSEGKLLQHVIGFQTFWERDYRVSPAVLVPRPETEVLLHEALPVAKAARLGLEVGVGSGILSIELLLANPGLRMVATDASSAALEVAQENALRWLGPLWSHRLRLVECLPSEVIAPFQLALGDSVKADFLISNPPYLLRSSEEVESDVAQQEPAQALFAPEGDPLFFYREIAENSGKVLNGFVNGAPAVVLLELPHERASQIAEVFLRQGWKVELLEDLTGRPRVLRAQMGEK